MDGALASWPSNPATQSNAIGLFLGKITGSTDQILKSGFCNSL
jgi:hypothetical protein